LRVSREPKGAAARRGEHRKLSRVAYRRFKESLLTGRIPTGSTSQADLIRTLDVPISPLREALQVLEAEGLLRVLPRSGIQIVKPDLELIKNCYQLRRLFEREAVVKFAITASIADLEAWETRHAELLRAADAGLEQPELGQRLNDVDDGFHQALLTALRNPLIEDAYRRTKERLALVALDDQDAINPLFTKQTMIEHLAVIEAIKAQDPGGAAAAMDAHLTRALHRAMGL
jgi:DNA-binding GntR family transcriptional regulator